MDQQTTLDQLASLVKHPLRLLRQGGKFGLNVIKKAIPTFLLFTFINVVAIVAAAVLLIGAYRENWMYFVMVLVIAVLVMIVVIYIIYTFVMAELSLAVYRSPTDYLHKFSDMVVAKVKQSAPTAAVERVVDVKRMASDAYSKVPGPLRKLVMFFIEQVPLVGIIAAARAKIENQDQQKASETLYKTLNVSIVAALERKIGEAKTIFVLVLNIVLHGVLIYLMM